MKIIISPAKQMVWQDDVVDASTQPDFLPQTRTILSFLQSLSYDQAKTLWGCSEKLARANYEILQETRLDRAVTPAVLAYDGIAYKYMAPSVFENGQFAYVQENLRILSAFYGALRPLDAVVPYRLEMQAKASLNGTRDLYEFWGSQLYDAIMKDNPSRTIINLASKEYSLCISRHLRPGDTFITCVFGQIEKEKVVQKGVYAKMARGDMVRFMAENNVQDPTDMQAYARLGYAFCPERSTNTEFVFLK